MYELELIGKYMKTLQSVDTSYGGLKGMVQSFEKFAQVTSLNWDRGSKVYA